jgi:hypothetical protein
MRMLLKISMPNKEFNAAVRDGSAGKKIGQILEEMKPEVIYFTEQNGSRGAIAIVNVPEPSRIPALAEPWFLTFNAEVEFRIAMSVEDLQKSSLEALGKKWA